MIFMDYANNQAITATVETSDMPVPRVGEDINIHTLKEGIETSGRVMKVTYLFHQYEDVPEYNRKEIQIDYIPYL